MRCRCAGADGARALDSRFAGGRLLVPQRRRDRLRFSRAARAGRRRRPRSRRSPGTAATSPSRRRARNFFAEDDPDPAGSLPGRRDLSQRPGDRRARAGRRRRPEVIEPTDASRRRRGAQNPSLSADGRYVAFSTAQQLVPEDQNPNVDVYVRDMTVPIRSPGAYELVPPETEEPFLPRTRHPIRRGDHARPGDQRGRPEGRVQDHVRLRPARRERADRDPDRAGAVRDRRRRSTTLVTLTNEPPAGQTELAPAGGARGAVISADGTTVAWAGERFRIHDGEPGQTPLLSGEYRGRSPLLPLAPDRRRRRRRRPGASRARSISTIPAARPTPP